MATVIILIILYSLSRLIKTRNLPLVTIAVNSGSIGRNNMAPGNKSKNARRLKSMHDYLHTKVEEAEAVRESDRSANGKMELQTLKKQKLALKDKLKG
jgi:uncharacterized protein YdcH (DUF465 family)